MKRITPAPLQLRQELQMIGNICVGCGCSDLDACPGGCSWAIVDEEMGVGLCSKCVLLPLHALIERAQGIFAA
jgi:23S rRNA C2498 (ribose-2'-O)-methylase RlmM